jgi:hypothetical protein
MMATRTVGGDPAGYRTRLTSMRRDILFRDCRGTRRTVDNNEIVGSSRFRVHESSR